MKVSLWKVVLGLVVIALLIGGGSMLYRAGYARGTMSGLSFDDMPFAGGGRGYEEMTPYGGYYGMMGRAAYSRFSFGGMLFGGLIFLLIAGGILRLVFGGMRRGYMPPWAMHRMRYEGEGAPWMRNHPYWGKMPEDGEAEKEG
jgi:hypothetical protein